MITETYNKLNRLFRNSGEFVKHGHWKMMHLFDGASHPQVVQYIVMDGRDCFFLSGEQIKDSDLEWLFNELVS